MATEPQLLTTNFFTHSQRLRRAVLRLVLVFVGSSALASLFAAPLLHVLVRPLGKQLVMYAPMEGLSGYITIALTMGGIFTGPFVLYELYRFLRVTCHFPRFTALASVLSAGGLFLLGASFCYLVILPVTLRFLLSFGGENISAGIAVSRYLALMLGLSSACGVIFELPLVVMLLHTLGLLRLEFLTHNRRYAILVGAIFTAILTPTPDAFTMSAMLLPLLTLYEVSILLVRLAIRRDKARGTA
jgi:sec-independent protein translocase protein TatC